MRRERKGLWDEGRVDALRGKIAWLRRKEIRKTAKKGLNHGRRREHHLENGQRQKQAKGNLATAKGQRQDKTTKNGIPLSQSAEGSLPKDERPPFHPFPLKGGGGLHKNPSRPGKALGVNGKQHRKRRTLDSVGGYGNKKGTTGCSHLQPCGKAIWGKGGGQAKRKSLDRKKVDRR